MILFPVSKHFSESPGVWKMKRNETCVKVPLTVILTMWKIFCLYQEERNILIIRDSNQEWGEKKKNEGSLYKHIFLTLIFLFTSPLLTALVQALLSCQFQQFITLCTTQCWVYKHSALTASLGLSFPVDQSPRARHPGMWSQVGLRKYHYEQS